jgi:hypothetical protein
LHTAWGLGFRFVVCGWLSGLLRAALPVREEFEIPGSVLTRWFELTELPQADRLFGHADQFGHSRPGQADALTELPAHTGRGKLRGDDETARRHLQLDPLVDELVHLRRKVHGPGQRRQARVGATVPPHLAVRDGAVWVAGQVHRCDLPPIAPRVDERRDGVLTGRAGDHATVFHRDAETIPPVRSSGLLP